MWLLPVLSGIFMGFNWPPANHSFLLLFSLVPLLKAEQYIILQKRSYLTYLGASFSTFFLWHVISQSWVFALGWGNAIGISVLNSFLLSLFLLPAHLYKRKGYTSLGHIVWVGGWLSFEMLHQNWELAYPLLQLGNGLYNLPWSIQWYELTGVWGGSLWMLLINILAFHVLDASMRNTLSRRLPLFLSFVVSICIPLLFSLFIWVSQTTSQQKIEVAIVHPNIDCYMERFQMDPKSMLDKFISLSMTQISPSTDVLLWTENAMVQEQWLDYLDEMTLIKMIKDSFKLYPNLSIISGTVINERFRPNQAEMLPLDIPFNEALQTNYLTYNAAIQIVPINKRSAFRSKQRLVPFEEGIPYPQYLGTIRELLGTKGNFTFSTRKYDKDIFITENGVKTSTLICYESAFGGEVASKVRKGAQLLFVVLNEGWYKNLKGAEQFKGLSVIRAIENRRAIARASNDGISCFINKRGEVQNYTDDFSPLALKQNMEVNNEKTFYSLHGDYIGWISLGVWISLSIIILTIALAQKIFL